MPNKKISQLPLAGTLTGSEKIILTQSGDSVQSTLTQVIALVMDDDTAYVHLSGDTMTGTLIAPIVSATTFFGNGSNLSGIFDTYVTGGTYSNPTGTITLTNNSGNTFNVTGLYTGVTNGTFVHLSGDTMTGNLYAPLVSASTLSNGFQLTINGAYSHAEGQGYSVNTATSVNTTAINYFEYDEYAGSVLYADTTTIIVGGDYSTNTVPYTCSFFTIDSGSGPLTINNYYYSRPRITAISYNGGLGQTTFTFSPALQSSYYDVTGTGSTANGVASHVEGTSTTTIGEGSHAEGLSTIGGGKYSHAEGYLANASGISSHAEGSNTIASGTSSHTEGQSTLASGQYSHAEGYISLASGIGSHAEGNNTIASGPNAHAEGLNTIAIGVNSHAEGYSTIASGSSSHAEGYGTIASGDYQNAMGRFNTTGNTTSLVVIGNGTDDNTRSNLVLFDTSGVTINGILTVSGATPLKLQGLQTQNDSNILSIDSSGVIHKISSSTLSADTYVTGGTYSNQTGTATFTNNTGGTFTVSQWNYVTGGTQNNNLLTLRNNSGGTTTYTPNAATGGTYSNGTITLLGSGSLLNITGITSTSVDVIPFVSGFTTWNKTGYVQIIVTDPIRGGIFVPYTGSVGADSGMIFSDGASNKWIRKISDFIDITWYGATATATGTYDNYANVVAAISAASITEILSFPRVKIPACSSTTWYYMSNTITADTKINLFGDGSESKLRFRGNKSGIILNYITSRNSQISDIDISCYSSTGSTFNNHGLIIKDRVICNNVSVREFNGNGFEINNTVPSGNSSNSLFTYCNSEQNILHGYHVVGSDCNNMTFTMCSAVSNGGLGVCDQSFLGNNYYGFHAASNGSPQLTYQKGLVTLTGHTYAALFDGFTNISPSGTSGTTYWYDLGTLWATGYTAVSAYTSAATYYAVGSWNLDGFNITPLGSGQNQLGTLTGCYSEADQAPSYIGQRCLSLGGDNGAGQRANAAFIQANSSMMYTTSGMSAGNPAIAGVNRSYFDPNGFTSMCASTEGMTVGWDNTVKAMEIRSMSNNIGDSRFKVLGAAATAASTFRTNAPSTGIPVMPNGFIMATPQNRNRWTVVDMANTKPSTAADLGDMQIQTYYNYLGDKPEVISYKRIEKSSGASAQWIRAVGFTEYEFQTTTSGNTEVCLDYYLTKGIQYDVNIFASNSINSDLWSEKRFVVIKGTNPTVTTSIASNETIGTPLKDSTLSAATLSPITNDAGVGLYSIQWRANGVNSTTINWKVQLKRAVL